MKKILILIIIVIIGFIGYYYFNYVNGINKILKQTQKEEFTIDYYSVFGTHLSISGCTSKIIDDELELVLKNTKEEIVLDSNFYKKNDKTCFNVSENNNDGIYLDGLSKGNYMLLIKEGNDSNLKYYTVKNNTEYEKIEYYTVTKNNSNNKIDISFKSNKDKNYMEYKIHKTKLPKNVYDIVIDPGHGGKDVGATSKLNGQTYYESDLTLKISLQLKKKLENLGLKVKLTREDDTYLEPYGKGGRALLPNDYNSKYSFSIHLNSATGTMSYGGVEIYIPNDVDLSLASSLANNLAEVINYSKKVTDKVEDGIYFTSFTKSDIKSSNEEMQEKNMKPFDIKEGSPYMYMIREVGGINTYAYIDGRNEEYGLNDYYNSNKTAEPYLLEIAYISYPKDLDILVNSPDKLSSAISNAIKKYLDIS